MSRGSALFGSSLLLPGFLGSFRSGGAGGVDFASFRHVQSRGSTSRRPTRIELPDFFRRWEGRARVW
ncbi:hypothetical protein XELAEV_18027991mg [Xenopus laevis]|uniref:Secreted protein n=1 Tax=Xenopus laevis TaxID=8355 RepID=A0A974CXE4_XENLA|nr:hypothetical protein XELAEV_18027991mg [Xenopus laevis]